LTAIPETAFAGLVERHRRELRVHCYRMLGSFSDAEDLVQETFLRAWRARESFQGRSSVRAWLYRIATNACLDALDSRPPRVLPHHLSPPSDPSVGLPARTDLPWLQPFPDRLLEPAAPGDAEPDAAVVDRETIELAFLAAIQHLPPRQRAVLILRDVLGWPAKQAAALLDTSLPATNSALQRARATLKQHLPERRLEWAPAGDPTDEERKLLRRYMEAFERADAPAVAALLREDFRATMPPFPMWFLGREATRRALTASFDPGAAGYQGRFRMLPTRANRQPAIAAYVRRPTDRAYRPFAIGVIGVEAGLIAEIDSFHAPELFPAFDLPAAL
jgi:RNA polymerase sigma-70 factor, ECF subfamily